MLTTQADAFLLGRSLGCWWITVGEARASQNASQLRPQEVFDLNPVQNFEELVHLNRHSPSPSTALLPLIRKLMLVSKKTG